MIYGLDQLHSDEPLGGLTSELKVRVLNGSATGCLVESMRSLAVGTVAGLRVTLLGREYDDEVQVTRCQAIAGAGSTYHIAVQFLSTTPPYAGTLRHAIHRELGQFSGFIHPPDGGGRPEEMSRRRTADATET